MSSKRCCVPQCVEVEGSYRVLHWFPNPDKDIARFRTWVHAIGGEILSLSNENIYKLRRVCHAHFEEKYCCRYNKISNIAVPTLHMPGPLSKFICTDRKPLREVENLPSTSKGQYLHLNFT
ncbi:uncharacterized protein LOC123703718 [Colias croceus]|uniref:uncharacterized protein LOC123703718 n=1 Tax=Colias crocea TaxID=72248 RepID=UPI001E27CF91|nr:uncharacterized protein LOC123701847 isoform X1 [Colias croceus]XP_045507767.1 uncharacterized protein LOC123703718 [Colias croceus]